MATTSAYAIGGSASDDELHLQRPSHQHTLSSASFVSAQSDSNEDFFSSINGLDDFGGDDDLCFDVDDESRDEVKDLASDGSGKNKKSKRLGANTAEKKATHNAVERARRESLNTRFLVLADMLPGMVNIKRASKAAIVNKSIDLIRELRKTECQLSKENETLKAELEALRSQSVVNAARMGGLPVLPSGSNAVNAGLSFAPMGLMGYHPHAQAQAQMYQNQMQQMGLAGFPPMMPMMAPAMPQQQNSPPTANDLRPLSARSGSQSPAFVHQAQQQFPAYPAAGMNGMFDFLNGQTAGPTDTAARSGSPATPASEVPALPNPALAAAAYSGFGYPPFDLAGYVGHTATGASPQAGSALPGAFGSRKDSLAVSAMGSGTGSQAASSPSSSTSSPPSSHSVPTPANTYSPIPLPPVLSSDRNSASSPVLAQPLVANDASTGNPAYAAFDMSSDPAFLAASFAPRDLAKAQSDLQNFIQFQQSQARMSQAMLNFQNIMPQQMQQGQMPAIKEEHASFQSTAGRQQPFDGADMGAYFQANWGMMMGASAAAN